MGLGIASFSRFVTEMQHRSLEEDAVGLARWAVEDLSRTLGFDAAWYGWASLRPEGVEVYANATLNLPEGFHDYWLTIADQDLLARYMIENPGETAIYDRSAASPDRWHGQPVGPLWSEPHDDGHERALWRRCQFLHQFLSGRGSCPQPVGT